MINFSPEIKGKQIPAIVLYLFVDLVTLIFSRNGMYKITYTVSQEISIHQLNLTLE